MRNRDIDTLIREALSEEDAAFLASLDEPTLPEQLTEVFRGRWRWVNALSILVVLWLFLAGLYCVVAFLRADEVASMLRWGAGAAFCLVAVGFMKAWYWMELQRVALTREVKRLELQVAHLAAKLR